MGDGGGHHLAGDFARAVRGGTPRQDVPALALLLIGVGKISQDGLFLALGMATAAGGAVVFAILF